ncbi:MAG: penicillin-binding protein 2 [Breznakibacter sp.]|nr:penicillin-binding protein 2 [Breznakibacter sp.]
MFGNSNRTLVLAIIIIAVGIIFSLKLFVIQVVDSSYKFSADNNSRRKIIVYPARGVVTDRNGKLLVSNQAVYDIMVTPRELAPFDSVDFCNSLGISMNGLRGLFVDLKKGIRSKKISQYKASVFLGQVTARQYGVFQEKEYKFKGFFAQRRTLRSYQYPIAAHLLGYIGEVYENMIKKDSYYSMGDYRGISGIENTYEKYLRGEKGSRFMMVDVHGREKGYFAGGKYDTASVNGKDIQISIDADLQAYAELLMANKIGSVIAIEPSTGEILTMVSSPTYDPSILIGRDRIKNYPLLSNDPVKPLFNRAIMAQYPPGSTFKLMNALIGLQDGVIFPSTTFGCSRGYHVGGLTVGCHVHGGPLDLRGSVSNSCNAYYCNVFRRIIDNDRLGGVKKGLDHWKEYANNFGLGRRMGIDFDTELKGLIPGQEYYNKIYNGSWNSVTIISLSIGQGEVLSTPVQMANVVAAIANRGWYYTPHVIRSIEDNPFPEQFKIKQKTGIDSLNFLPVIDGMEQAVSGGTARIAQIEGINIVGKTGTAQNPHGKDHSVFVCFAPKENPKIAVAVFVENAGFGATFAAPIASLVVEKYMKGSIDPKRKVIEDRMVNTDLIHGEGQ